MVTCIEEVKIIRVVEKKGSGLKAEDPVRLEISYWTPAGKKIGEFNQYDDPFNPARARKAAKKREDD